jgi:cardiolipin synthase
MDVGLETGARREITLVCLTLVVGGCFPARVESSDASAPAAKTTAVTLLVGPDDGAAPVLSFIRSARRSLCLEMYLLTDDDAIQALIDQQFTGRDVKVILEPHPFGADGANQAAYDRLAAAGVTVTWASARFALTHAKLIVADGQHALVMTLNLTHAGLTSNREFAAIDDNASDIADAAAIFAADFAGIPPPAATPASSPRGHLLASPVNARDRIGDLIAGARRTLAIEMEELSDVASVGALLAAVGRGVTVTVVLPGTSRSASTDAAAQRLAAGGASVRGLTSPTVHAKAVVADGARLYLGSVNLTAASLDDNREFGLRLDDDPTATTRVAGTIAADWARAAEL